MSANRTDAERYRIAWQPRQPHFSERRDTLGNPPAVNAAKCRRCTSLLDARTPTCRCGNRINRTGSHINWTGPYLRDLEPA
jgi:hypothetical protein